MAIFNKYQTVLFLCLWIGTSFGQKKKYLPVVVGFYNLENFYDTVRNTAVDDVDFSINGRKNYSSSVYKDKLDHVAHVLSDIGLNEQQLGFAFLGVAELENDTVLLDIVKHPLLVNRKLQFVHFDSKDRRGVDVGLLYNPAFFRVLSAKPLFVPLPANSKSSYFTRDILHVEGKLLGEKVHVYVNHWPSRVGGEKKSYPARAAAARVLRKHINAVRSSDSSAHIIVMGDMNDDPVSRSIAQDLGADNKGTKDTLLYNPWIEKYSKGDGTLAYRNSWSLFDQILFDKSWLALSDSLLFYRKATIFKPDYLVEQNGNYKGYPKRTFSGDSYQNGFSDHFPVYVTFLKYVP